MLNVKVVIVCLFASMLLISCSDGIDKKLLPGEWKGAEWIVAGAGGEIDASSASFSFQPDGKYIYTYNDAVENGKYYIINGGELYTTPDGGTKMMVKITKLTQDSLVFNMNRGGQSETLTLLREK